MVGTQKKTKTDGSLLTVLFLGVLMGALDIAIVGPALPAIQNAFAIDERAVVWIFTMYVLFNLIGAPLMAKLSDRYGRRAVYLADVALFAGGSLLVALAPNFGLLLAGRALQGISAGGIFPVASAVIGDTFPEEKKGRALGMIGAVFGLAFIVGPILGGILLIWGWQWLFLVNLPVAGLVMILGSRSLPTTRPAVVQPFDLPGMAALAVAVIGLTLGVNRLDTTAIGASLLSVGVWPWLLLAVTATFLFVLAERRAADPIIRLAQFGNRQLRRANLLSMGAGLGEAAMVFLPALAVAAFGVTESRASFLLLPVVLAVAIGSPLGGRLLDSHGPRPVILGGTLLLTLGMLLLGLLGTDFNAFVIAGICIGFGLASLLGAPIRYIVLTETNEGERAAGQGLLTIATGVGQLISGALIGAVAASQGGGVVGYTVSYLFVAGAGVVLIFLALGLKGKARQGV
ncbi:MAG: MFS transporter [Caldilineaceae bacterium]|nr:MFS transporter [Caldilineaceae bacterium]